MKSAAYGVLLMLVCFVADGQALLDFGYTTNGINVNAGYRTPSGFNLLAGYSISNATAKPQIATLSIGKVVTFQNFEIVPSFGISRYKKDRIANNDHFDVKPKPAAFFGLEVGKHAVFGNVHSVLNYTNGFYAGAGITAFFGSLKTEKKNIWEDERRWYIPSGREALSYGLYSFGGMAKGRHDAMIYHGWGTGHFWGPEQWKNKYKHWPDDQRAAFPGAKDALVIFTDGTHLTNFLDVASLAGGTVVNFWNIKQELQQYPKRTRALAFITKKIIYPVLFRALAFEAVWRNSKK